MEPRTYTSEYRELVALVNAQGDALKKCQQERDVVTSRYHDGMKALLWLVQLHAKAEATDEIEAALEVAEEKLGI